VLSMLTAKLPVKLVSVTSITANQSCRKRDMNARFYCFIEVKADSVSAG
jgi:hypothetical protein